MANTKEPNTDLDFMREAYRQLHSSSRVLLDTFEVSWTEGFLLRQVHTLAGRRLETLDEDLSDEITLESSRRSSLNSDAVRGDHIVIGEISGASSVAIGSGANLSVSRVKNPRDEQYEIAKHWDGQRLMREFDLSERDLSGLNLANADLQKANLKAADLAKANMVKADLSEADLSGTNLLGADLSGANLNGARYTTNTTWPKGFDPEKTGANLVDGEESA